MTAHAGVSNRMKPSAVTGQKVSSPLFESMQIIGRTEVLRRLKKANERLEQSE